MPEYDIAAQLANYCDNQHLSSFVVPKASLTDCESAIGYVRVSTQHQGQNGYSLDIVQEADIQECCNRFDLELLAVKEDCEKGWKRERIGLYRAVELAQQNRCPLLVWSCSRLIRPKPGTEVFDYELVRWLSESGVPFCEVRSFASDAEMASYRSAEISAYKKSRSELVGRPKSDVSDSIMYEVAKLESQGCSLSEIARHLNKLGYKTPNGRSWTHKQVARLPD